MLVLGIESSCDETAVAVVERSEKKNRVICEKIKSQIPLHTEFGGVVPEIASRNHYEVIDYLTCEVLSDAGLSLEDLGLVAVTQGPGLIGSLLVGLSFAKGVSFAHSLPLVPVNHVLAHIESVWVSNPGIEFPLVALVVSGGHTTIFYQESKFANIIFAKTRDDAVGEIFDKTAKYFGLGYPGGPILDKVYPEGDSRKFPFTIPKMSDGSNDFSFSGYKTAVLRIAKKENIKAGNQAFNDLIASFLHSVFDYLLGKTQKAVAEYKVKSVIIAGGVSRNTLFRDKFSNAFKETPIGIYFPAPELCTDNATMVAWLGYEIFKAFPNGHFFNYSLNSFSRKPLNGINGYPKST